MAAATWARLGGHDPGQRRLHRWPPGWEQHTCGGIVSGSAGNAQNVPISGDINFDSGEGTFWTSSSFLAVATHEIGHSLGLRHTSVSGSLMEPFYNAAITTPQAEDIAGIRSIYGMTGAVAGSVSINDVTITEGNAGTQIATFTVSRTGGTAAFAVNFATVNNSALSGSDYVATAGTLSFGSGVNTQTVSVTINGDTTVEPTETFFVNLSAATGGATISDSQGVGAITNDDAGATNDPNFLGGTPGSDFLMGRARKPDDGRRRRGRHLHRRRPRRRGHRGFGPGLGHRHDREPRLAVHPAGERRDLGLAGTGNIGGTGNALNNLMIGNEGANMLEAAPATTRSPAPAATTA